MTKTKYVHVETFKEYSERFKDHFRMEKTADGIVIVWLSTQGGPAVWSYQLHNAMCELWTAIGHDKSAELLILTGAEGNWICDSDPESFREVEQDPNYQRRFNNGIIDTIKIIERFVMDIDIPTIGVLPGKGFHWDAPVLCDITLCAPEMRFSDGHYIMGKGTVPGDGMTMLMQHFMGYKQANLMSYTSQGISAEEAKAYGLVTEVVEADKIMDRAMELAQIIMSRDRIVRRLTHQVVVRPLKRRVMEEIHYHVTAEMYSTAMMSYQHDFDDDEFLRAKGLK